MSSEEIIYDAGGKASAQELSELFKSSGIIRPSDDLDRLQEMLENADLIVTARKEGKLVGIARALTDFSYCCYLSDLAVSEEFQHSGIGKKLVEIVAGKIGERCLLLLLSAPGAMEYYPKIGFEKAENAFIIRRKR